MLEPSKTSDGDSAQSKDLDEYGRAIIAAVEGNQLDRVRELHREGANLEARDRSGRPALLVAVDAGFDELALALLELGAAPDAASTKGWTALQKASKETNLRLIEALLKSGADPNDAPPKGTFALRHIVSSKAAVEVRLKALDLLLEAGANPDLVTEPTLPFMCTVAFGRVPGCEQILARLLEANASDLANQHGWTAAMVARWSGGREPLVAMLPEDEASERVRSAVTAAAKGDQPRLLALLDEGVDVQATDPNGASILGICCLQKHWPLAEALVARGANPLATDKKGYNPAALCYVNGQVDLMWSMFDAANTTNDAVGNCRALLNAVTAKDQQNVARLLERGANPDSKDTQGQSALLLAVAKGQSSIAELLLQHGANPNTGAGTKTALHYVVETGDLALVKAMLDAGADPNGTVLPGLTAVRALVDKARASPKRSWLDLASLLLEHGASADVELKRLKIKPTTSETESKPELLLAWLRSLVDEEETNLKTLELRESLERLGATIASDWEKRDERAKDFASPALRMLASAKWPVGLRVSADEGALCGYSLHQATLHSLAEHPEANAWMGDDRRYAMLLDDLGYQHIALVALDEEAPDPDVFLVDYDGDENPPKMPLTEFYAALRPLPKAPSNAPKDAKSTSVAGRPEQEAAARQAFEVLERRPVYLLESRDEVDGLSRVGGLPPALGREGWPTYKGRPMVHVATVDIRELALFADQKAVAVSVFVHSVEDLSAFEAGSGKTHVAWIKQEALAREVHAPQGAATLELSGLRVSAFCELEVGAAAVAARFAPELNAKDLVQSTDAPFEAAYELLNEILEDDGQPSYLGGAAINPSSAGSLKQQDGPEGRFVMRLSESLIGEEANFAGGGWLFVYERDAWAEQ